MQGTTLWWSFLWQMCREYLLAVINIWLWHMEQGACHGVMDEAALGWQVNGLFLSPERLLSLAPPATAGLFPCASLTKLCVCFFVFGFVEKVLGP